MAPVKITPEIKKEAKKVFECLRAMRKWQNEHWDNWEYEGEARQFKLIGIDESEIPEDVKKAIEITNRSHMSDYNLRKTREAMGLDPFPYKPFTIHGDGTVTQDEEDED